MANLAAVELFRIDRSETAKPRSIRLSTTGPRGVSIATPTSPASPAANDSGHPSRPPARGDRGNGRDARTLDAALRTDPHCLRPLEPEVAFRIAAVFGVPLEEVFQFSEEALTSPQ